MSLEANKLSFRYPRRGRGPVLEGVSLTLAPGERLGLSGPSGRGKTTLCKLLAGYERPGRGEILLDGLPLSRYRGACPVQMIWQHPEAALDPLLPLGKSLEEAGPADPRLLEALHIQPGWLTRYPGELSGGELQRVLLAFALDPMPDLLLLDEPVSAVDRKGIGLFYDLVTSLRSEYHMPIILVSHDLSHVRRYATVAAVLEKTILCRGTPEEVLASPEVQEIFGLGDV